MHGSSKVICYSIIKFNNKPTKLLLLIIHFNKRNVWIYPILVPYTGLKFAHPPHEKEVTMVDSRTPDFYSPNKWLILPPLNCNFQVIAL